MYGFDYTNVKKTILEEPVVDVVDDRNVVTDACCVLVSSERQPAWPNDVV